MTPVSSVSHIASVGIPNRFETDGTMPPFIVGRVGVLDG